MKQAISRDARGILKDLLGVYLPEGAPLVDSDWNEQAEVSLSLLRALAEGSGVEGTCGRELQVRLSEGASEEVRLSPADVLIGGGPGPFFAGGLPLRWPRDRSLEDQDADCIEALPADLEGGAWTVYLRTSIGDVDPQDAPHLVDPALSGEVAPFRRMLQACVSVSPGEEMPPAPETSVRLTLSGPYLGEVNALYWVEILSLDGEEARAQLLWDDRNASVSTQLVLGAEAGATELSVADTQGFEVGHVVRLEGAGPEDAAYRVLAVGTSTLQVARLSCERPSASEGEDASDSEVDYGPAAGEDAPFIAEDTAEGLAAAAPILETQRTTTLKGDTASFSACLKVEARSDWWEGMEIEIAPGPDAEPPEASGSEDAGACWPAQAPLPAAERRRILRIYRMPQPGTTGGTMILHLDHPTSHAHPADTPIRPLRRVRVRRYRELVCGVPIHRADEGKEGTDGPCCHLAPLRLGPHLEVSLSVPVEAPLTAVPGDGWRFALRAGGRYEPRVDAPVTPTFRHHTPLATLRWEEGRWSVEDHRPAPRGCDFGGLLAPLSQACDEIAAASPWTALSTAALDAQVFAQISRPSGDDWAALGAALAGMGAAEADHRLVSGLQAQLTRALGGEAWREAPGHGALAVILSIVERLALAVAMAELGCCAPAPPPTIPTAPPPTEEEESSEPGDAGDVPGPEGAEGTAPDAPDPEVAGGASAEQASTEDTPDEATPDEEDPDEQASTEATPDEEDPDEQASTEDTPDEEDPAEQASTEDTPDEATPDEEDPGEQASTEDAPDEEPPAEPAPDEAPPTEAAQEERVPAQAQDDTPGAEGQREPESPQGEAEAILGISLFRLRVADEIPSSSMRALEGRWPTVGELLGEEEPLRGTRQLQVLRACASLIRALQALMPPEEGGRADAEAIEGVWQRFVEGEPPPRGEDIQALPLGLLAEGGEQ